MAEREGFEPPELSLNGFQDRRLKPLGHLSVSISDYGFPFLRTIFSAPPMYGLNTSGMTTVPSGC